MFFQKLISLVVTFVQWWLTSDQILFRHFLEHQAMFFALGAGLGINVAGALGIYFPINYLIPESRIEKIRNYLENKFPFLERHLKRADNFTDNFEDSKLNLLKVNKRKKVISKLIETYEYEYIAIFLLSVLPVPFLALIMTTGALFAVKTLKIRFGLFVVLFAKVVKVFALASIAYFAHYL